MSNTGQVRRHLTYGMRPKNVGASESESIEEFARKQGREAARQPVAPNGEQKRDTKGDKHA